MKKQVYKVGDRVKILSSLCGDNHVGKIGKITKQMFYSKSGKVISREIKVGKETCSYATEIKLLPPLKPKKSIKKMEKKKLDWVDIECTCGCKTSWRIIGVKQTVRVVMSQIL